MKKITFIFFVFLSITSVRAQIPKLDDASHLQRIKPDTTKPSLTKIYTGLSLDKLPEFPGGANAYSKFLSRNLRWPKGSEEATGRVILSFIVERNGNLSHFKIERSIGKELDTEALRVFKLSPKWTPGIKNGYKVRVRYFVPVSFEYSSH